MTFAIIAGCVAVLFLVVIVMSLCRVAPMETPEEQIRCIRIQMEEKEARKQARTEKRRRKHG